MYASDTTCGVCTGILFVSVMCSFDNCEKLFKYKHTYIDLSLLSLASCELHGRSPLKPHARSQWMDPVCRSQHLDRVQVANVRAARALYNVLRSKRTVAEHKHLTSH